MDTQGRLQEDTDDPTDPNQFGVSVSAFPQAHSMTTYDAALDDDSRYLYNSHDDLWYDWTTGEFSRYDPDIQVYIAVAGKEEEEEEKEEKNETSSLHEEEYDPYDDDDDGDDNNKPVKVDAPLLRLAVLDSTLLTVGHVVEVDSSGLTVGRDRSWDRHRLRLAELAVSKFHCQIYYDGGSYHITDQGSKNGTFINDERLCDPKTSSIPRVIRDLDRIQIGSSLFQAHQHKHGWQCDYCITGPENIVDISQGSREKNTRSTSTFYSNQSDINTTTTIDFKSKEQREKEWMDELRRRKRMYAPKTNPTKNVNDAAERRRQLYSSTTLPSYLRKTSITSEQQQWNEEERRAATIERTTVHTPVKGIGDSMLRKMGWKQGQTLGRTGTEGITVPITPKTQTHRAGLGKNSTTETLSYESPKAKIPRITRERYNALH